MAITKASAQTTVNSGTNAATAATVNQITTAPTTATVVAGGGTLGGVTISNVAITDSTFANVLSGDTAVSSAGGFVRITGTGFKTNANVFLGSTVLANTFVDSTRINANIPASAAGTYQFTVFNTDGSGAISPAGLLISGPPSWTSTSYSSSSLTLGVQLLASGDAPLTYYIQPGSANPQNLAVNSTGFLSGTVSSDGAYTITVVVDDAQGQSTQADIITTVTLRDPYFNLTVLALPADAAANVWIGDASTNNFNLTVTGDTRPTAFSPYKTTWSNYFDGTGDYLTAPNNAAFAFGTGDFTVEGWYYLNSGVTRFCLYDSGAGGSGGQFAIFQDSASGFFVRMTSDVTFGSPPAPNQWVHFAVTRSGTTVRLFFNGTQAATGTQSTNVTNTTPYIGFLNGFGSYIMNGYISNLRVVNGTAVYTTNFTPPTSPLTAITNTVLLTCQSNRLIDSSTNNFTLTKNGDVAVSNFAPLVETDTTTGSAYFDGTDDYLTAPANTAFNFGTGDFTLECWIYSLANQANFAGVITNWTSTTGFYFSFAGGSNNMGFSDFATYYINPSSVPIINNVWTHVAVTRSGTTLRMFFNGQIVGTALNNTVVLGGATGVTALGSNGGTSFNGYISDARIIKGTAVYTATFTPPTSPVTAVANTSLLTLQNRLGEHNHRFVDSGGNNFTVTRSGNATQGTFSPFSQTGWSNYFDGTDYFSIANNAVLNPETENFLMEAWIFVTGTTGNNQGINGKGTAGTDGYSFYITNSLVLSFIWNGTGGTTITAGTLTLNSWNHVAVVRNSNVIRLYLNGVGADSSTACTTDITTTSAKSIGRARGGNPLLGYMSNYRMIKGTLPAGYDATQATITVPTAQLASTASTAVLTCQSNRFIDNSTNVFAITRTGDVSVQAFSPFAPAAEYSVATNGGSAYFDGSGDYLSVPGTGTNVLTGDFTIELYVYFTNFSNSPNIINNYVSNNANEFDIEMNTDGTIDVYINGLSATRIVSNAAATLNAWNHIALTRNSSTVTLWLNGVSQGTYSFSGTVGNTSKPIIIGSYAGSQFLSGYISNLRIVNGTAVYTSAFTPPTAPPTPIVNTSLLLNFTNAGITDATGKNVLETANQTRLSTADKKYGTGSMLLDGTDDYVVMPYSQNYTFATGPFTIECWVKFNTLSGNRLIFDTYTSAATGGGYQLYWRGTGTSIAFYANGGVQAQSSFTEHATGTWYHVAVTRNAAGTLQIFIDGTSYASVSYATAIDIAASARPAIGIQFTTLTNDLDGYIDDLRVTKGFARYTANFTPPTDTFKLR